MSGEWKTRDGRVVKIVDMTDSHLKNTLAMLNKKGFVSSETFDFYMSCSGPNGDMAQMAFEQELGEVLRRTPLPVMGELEREYKRRGLGR